MQKPKASVRLCFCVCFEYTTRLCEAVDHKDDDDDVVFVVHDGFASGFVVYGGVFEAPEVRGSYAIRTCMEHHFWPNLCL